MRRLMAWATPEHAIAFALGVGIATLACLSPVQNDTWWHLRSGQEMARAHTWLFEDRFSSTAYGQFFWNQSWLSQLIFYGLFLVGGLPLLTLVCATAIVTAWAILWRLVHGPFTDRLLLVAAALASATATWSIRPQAFSVLLTMIVVSRATTDRWRALPWLFLLWANLHAGFVMGLALLIATVLSALVRDRNRFWTRAWWTAACGLATLVTPLGVRNWTEIVASMMRSRANAIQEWQPTALPPQQLAFWALAVLLVGLVVRSWRRLETPADRALTMAALVVLPLAVRSLRNVPAFAMVGAPAVSRLLFPAATTRFTRADRGGLPAEPLPAQAAGRPPRTHISGLLVSAAALLMAATVVVTGWRQQWPMLGWEPISPAAAAAISACRGPIYNTYEGGGPIIWFAPSQRVFIDSRQDPFPVSLIQQASEVERTGEYRALFERWHINCAALPPASPTVPRLTSDGWTSRFKDAQWVVLERPGTTSTEATSSPAP